MAKRGTIADYYTAAAALNPSRCGINAGARSVMCAVRHMLLRAQLHITRPSCNSGQRRQAWPACCHNTRMHTPATWRTRTCDAQLLLVRSCSVRHAHKLQPC
jgi:hypothetical protein